MIRFNTAARALAVIALLASAPTLGAQYFYYQPYRQPSNTQVESQPGYSSGAGYGTNYNSGNSGYNYGQTYGNQSGYNYGATQNQGYYNQNPRFATYTYESSSQPQQQYSSQDYITPPPPGLRPMPYPVELFMSEGYGRFGDYTFPILGGTRKQPTPTGTFTVKRKEIDYWSRSYQQPMPYSLFFTDAHAIHYGALDSPSRGCVHVDYYTAQVLFYSTTSGKTKVIIRP